MRQFNDRPIKREVQHIMFTTINKKGCRIIGLAGDHPEEYKKLLSLHFSTKRIDLVDFELQGEGIINKKISEVKPSMIMDCDFCDTVVNSGDELLKVFKNMSREYPGTKKVLAFTFSNRLKGGLTTTLNWLNENLYGGSLQFTGIDYSRSMASYAHWRIVGHTQEKFKESMLISYRDTTSMVSGIISW